MRVVEVHVEGFGLLHDVDVEGVGPGTTVVLGPNESGKSTLHAFLARTLFGHPRRDDARGRQRYEPLRGGVHGGSVVVEDDDGGRWVVQRRPGRSPSLRVVAPDGREHTARAALDPLLGAGTDLERFEQVWAIDLDALTGLGQLDGHTLQDLLFDAATVGAGRSLRGAAAAAGARRDGLWTPTATTRPLSVALRERDEARVALREARAAAAGTVDVRAARDRSAARIEALAEERTQLLAEEALLDRVLAAWPHVQARTAAAEVLAGLPDEPLATAVVDEVRRAASLVREAAAETERLGDELTALGDADSGTTLPAGVEAAAEALLALHGRTAGHRDGVDALRRAEGASAEAVAVRDAALREVGEGWDAERVLRVPVDAATREDLRLAVATLDDRGREVSARSRHRDELAGVVARRREALERRRAERPTPPPASEVRRAEQAVSLLRARLPVLEQAELLRRAASDAAPSEGARVGMLRLLPRWLGWVTIAVAMFLLALATSTVGGSVRPQVFVVVAIAVCVPLGFAVGRALADRSSRADRTVQPAREPSDAPASGDATATVAEPVDEDVRTAAVLLGLPVPPSLAQVERVASRIDAARSALDVAERLDREIAELTAELTAERAALTDADDAVERADAQLAEARGAWAERCVSAGLDPADEPRVTLVRHERIVSAAAAVRAAAQLTAEVAERAAAVADSRAAVRTALADAGVGTDELDDPFVVLDRVVTAVRAAAADREDVAARRGQRQELERALARAVERRDRAAARRDEGLAAIGAVDLDDVERLVATDARRTAELARRDAAVGRLAALLGEGERSREAWALLDDADPIAWESRRAEVAGRLAAVDADRDELVREHARLAAAVEEVGGDDAVPVAAQRLAAAQARVDRLARDWIVADGAARVLEGAVEAFERDQHPRVLVVAGGLLEVATLGEWTRLRQVDRVLVASRRGADEPIAIDQLSRGTQEQVYLCLRLALAGDRARVEGRSLPLLVDDLLGTTDPERAVAVARVLADVAREQQVWLFTCDPRTASLVVGADDGARVLELERGGRVVGWRPGRQVPPHGPPPLGPPPQAPPGQPRG